MKTKKEEITARPAYKRYTAQFKEQALGLVERDGIPKVEAALYAWWAKRQQLQQAEMARLKHENAQPEYEKAFLKKCPGFVGRYKVYLNRKRLHSKLGYLSPEAFEAKNPLSRASVKSGQNKLEDGGFCSYVQNTPNKVFIELDWHWPIKKGQCQSFVYCPGTLQAVLPFRAVR